MIKIDEQPIGRRMTGVARRAVFTSVGIIVLMAIDAGCRNTTIIAINMAGQAVEIGVTIDKREE